MLVDFTSVPRRFYIDITSCRLRCRFAPSPISCQIHIGVASASVLFHLDGNCKLQITFASIFFELNSLAILRRGHLNCTSLHFGHTSYERKFHIYFTSISLCSPIDATSTQLRMSNSEMVGAKKGRTRSGEREEGRIRHAAGIP